MPPKKIPEFSLAVLPGLFRSVDAARALKNSKVSDRLQDIANGMLLEVVQTMMDEASTK